MIAEFQFISNRFDATQGRSQGVQVNVITKSGTNQMAGSLRANFRDDRFNAENQALGRKVPISNQQYAGSAGGPIIRDRLHYFGFYEYEREPRTSIWNTPYPRFNVELKGNVSKKLGAVVSTTSSPQMRFMVKGNLTKTPSLSVPAATTTIPPTRIDSGNAEHDAGAAHAGDLESGVERGPCGLGGLHLRERKSHPLVEPLGSCERPIWSGDHRVARIQFTGFNITGNNGYPRHRSQDLYSVQDSFTLSYNAKGRHDMKARSSSSTMR